VSFLARFFGTSESTFVEKEVLKKLPKSVTIRFTPEFDDEGNPIVFISSPEHEGIISEARSHREALANARDAILTYFDVPRACAGLIKFTVEDAPQDNASDGVSIRIHVFRLKDSSHA
jgi:predicted RNase H-like HicB family nuclease